MSKLIEIIDEDPVKKKAREAYGLASVTFKYIDVGAELEKHFEKQGIRIIGLNSSSNHPFLDYLKKMMEEGRI